MIYQNPFQLLDIPHGELEHLPKLIRQAKKRWLAEFELQGTTTIEIKGQTFDKNGVLKLIEQAEQQKGIYTQILQFPNLLNFLETGNTVIFNTSLEEALWVKDKVFLEQVAPYFAHRFNRVLAGFLKNRDLAAIQTISDMYKILPARYQFDCFKFASRYWKKQYNTLKELRIGVSNNAPTRRLKRIPKEIHTYYTSEQIELFNAMTFPSFQFLRDSYADLLIETSLYFYNVHHKKRRAKFILQQAGQLDISPNLHYRIQYVLDQYNGLPQSKWGFGEPNPVFSIWYKLKNISKVFKNVNIWIIVYFVLMLLRLIFG